MPHNLHNTLQSMKGGKFYSLPQLGKALNIRIERLPISVRIVLESVLRNCDGKKVTEEHVRQLASWKPNATRTDEIPFVLARIVLQDFTGVPLLCDLAAMRNVAHKMGKDPKVIEPLVPVDLVVDHSIQIDHYGSKGALDLNMKLEFKRNEERYQFMKWGMQAFDTFKVVPPGIGIVHQVNLESLARGVHQKDGIYYPDTLVGTDSHTTMINGIGVVGWGVGGIEAEAGMLGQPVYFLTPDVVGVNLKGKLHPACTATVKLPLSLNAYQTQAMQSAQYPKVKTGDTAAVNYVIHGLTNEAGEVSGKWKKFLRGDYEPLAPGSPPIPALLKERLLDEGGDTLWYLAAICTELGVTLEQLAQANLDKTADRLLRGVVKGDGDKR